MTGAAVVFGATGFIGRNLVAGLARRGAEVVAVSRAGGATPGAARGAAMADIDSLDIGPDAVVFHLAAARYRASTFEADQSAILAANTALTNQIYDLCARRGVTEVRLASSSAVYPSGAAIMDDGQPLDLNSPMHPREALYGWSKRWAEVAAALYHARYGINTISFRLSNPYGPHDSTDPDGAHVAAAFILRALAPGAEFELHGADVERDFIAVDDVVEVLWRSMAWRGRQDAFNLASGRSTSLRALAEGVLRLSGADKRLIIKSGAGAGPAARRQTAERIRTAFGIEAFADLDQGLPPAIAWYRHVLAG